MSSDIILFLRWYINNMCLLLRTQSDTNNQEGGYSIANGAVQYVRSDSGYLEAISLYSRSLSVTKLISTLYFTAYISCVSEHNQTL